MELRGLKQVELGERVGVTQAAVSKWLRGSVAKGDQLLALQRELGVTMHWLLTGEPPRDVEDTVRALGYTIRDEPRAAYNVGERGGISEGFYCEEHAREHLIASMLDEIKGMKEGIERLENVMQSLGIGKSGS